MSDSADILHGELIETLCKCGCKYRHHGFKLVKNGDLPVSWQEPCNNCDCEDFQKQTNFDILERAAKNNP